MRKLTFALATLALLGLTHVALAQSSLGIGAAETAQSPASGPFAGVFIWLAAWQQAFFTSLRQSLLALRDGQAGAWALIGLSFAYGVFHAAGPGHGKAVVSAYMLANEVQLRRGVALAFLSSLFQALTALIVVGAGWFLLRGTGLSMHSFGHWLEIASALMIVAFGLWLLLRKLRPLFARQPKQQLLFAEAGHFTGGSAGSVFSTAVYDADVCTADEADCTCGRQHMADPASLSGDAFSIRSALSAALAVGLRPCAGALVVLTFALVNGMWAAGVLSVASMALGTAITVSGLAVLSVYAKNLALRLGAKDSRLRLGLEITGAVLMLVFGLLLLGSALQL